MVENKTEKLYAPESWAVEWGIALLCFAVSCLYLRLFYDYSILNADEGIVLQGAQRILQGQVLYRDFFSFFTPGSYYTMALLFKIFGSSILVARAALIVYGGIFSALTYLLARRVCARWSALFACYAVTLTCLPFRFIALHNWDSTLLAYVTLYCAVRWVETGDWKLETGNWKIENRKWKIGNVWAFATGSFAALTFLFEHSKGSGLLLGLLAGYSMIVWRGHDRPFFGLRQLAGLAAGFAWPCVVTFGYFAAHRALIPALTDWAWPVIHYSGANRLPYGYLVMSTPDRGALFSGSWGEQLVTLVILGPSILLPVLPLVALGIFIWFAVGPTLGSAWAGASPGPTTARGERGPAATDARWAYVVLVSAVLCGLLASTFLTKRPDFTHLNYLAPLFYLVFAWVFDGLNLPSRLWHSLKPLVVFVAFLSYTAFGMMQLTQPLGAHHKLTTARGTIKTPGPEGALEYLQAHVAPGERIFVYPYQPLYYYLTGTFNATRFDFLQPGMHTSEQFQEAIREVDAERPRVVLFGPSFSEKFLLIWPNTPLEVIAAKDPVEEYIFVRYRPCRALAAYAFWHFVFMVRKDSNCPQAEAAGSAK